MKILLLCVVQFFAAGLAEAGGLSCYSSAGKLAFEFHSYDDYVIRIQFPGLTPERFFSRQGGGRFVEFATRSTENFTPLKNKVDTKSTLEIQRPEGGVSVRWRNGKTDESFSCGQKISRKN